MEITCRWAWIYKIRNFSNMLVPSFKSDMHNLVNNYDNYSIDSLNLPLPRGIPVAINDQLYLVKD